MNGFAAGMPNFVQHISAFSPDGTKGEMLAEKTVSS